MLVKFVKLAKVHIPGPLTHIINRCIATSSVPRLWKIARISPIPKVDEPLSDADYHPVSILPTLSKVFEHLVLNQLIVYINEEALLSPTVSGFWKGHSTTTVLLGICDALTWASSRGEVTLMVCVDYSKAFDNIQFRSVVSKMHSLGFSKYFLLWMTDCLTQRRQLVQIDDRRSDMATMEFCAPQGSILGPVILNLYVTDLQSELQCDCYHDCMTVKPLRNRDCRNASLVNANFSVNQMCPIICRWKLVKHRYCFGDNRRTKDNRKIKLCGLKACCVT